GRGRSAPPARRCRPSSSGKTRDRTKRIQGEHSSRRAKKSAEVPFPPPERCPSGLRSTLGKRVCPKGTEGSNPSLSATISPVVPRPKAHTIWGQTCFRRDLR